MAALLLGVALISFASALVPGPVLAVAIAKGFQSPRGGFYVALGHVLTDAIIILVIYYGLSQFFENETVKLWLYLMGGALTIWLGIVIYRSRNKPIISGTGQTKQSFLLGVIATLFNPMFWLWWATAGSMFIMRFSDYGMTGIVLFVLAIELPALIWYSVAGMLTYKTNSYAWGQQFRRWAISGSGLALIGFGLFFIWSGLRIIM